MDRRLKLQSLLEELLESRNVYYQPPETVKMKYPAIVYSKDLIRVNKADGIAYKKKTKYSITVISLKPDNSVIEKILDLPYCSYDRTYVSDNLYHECLTLYY